MKKASKAFSYGMFWVENGIFITIFFMLEMCLVPIVYIKVFLNIVTCSMGLFTIMF